MFETTTCIGVALGHSLVFLSPVKETRIYTMRGIWKPCKYYGLYIQYYS